MTPKVKNSSVTINYNFKTESDKGTSKDAFTMKYNRVKSYHTVAN